MTSLADGTLTALVHPAYVALAATEGEYVAPERREQIQWRTEDEGRICGYASPATPPGEYWFVQYFRGPQDPAYAAGRLDQPCRHGANGPRPVGPIFVDGDLIIAQL